MAVNAIRAGFAQCLGQRDVILVLFVVDAGVKAQFVDHVIAFVFATSNAHHAAAACFGQCTISAAHSTARRAHGHGLACFGRDDFHQAIPSGHAGHADRAEVMRQRYMAGVHLAQGAQNIGINDAVFLPAPHAHDLVTCLEFGVAAVHHLAHGPADHDLAQRLGHGVAFALVHAPAHVRVQAHEVVFHEHLAILQSGNRRCDLFEVGHSGLTLRAIVENDLMVEGHVCLRK